MTGLSAGGYASGSDWERDEKSHPTRFPSFLIQGCLIPIDELESPAEITDSGSERGRTRSSDMGINPRSRIANRNLEHW